MTPAPRSTERMSEVRMLLRSVTAFFFVWLMIVSRGGCRGEKFICCQVVEACCLSVAQIYINECDGKAEACKQVEKRVELSEQAKECNLSQTKKNKKRVVEERDGK